MEGGGGDRLCFSRSTPGDGTSPPRNRAQLIVVCGRGGVVALLCAQQRARVVHLRDAHTNGNGLLPRHHVCNRPRGFYRPAQRGRRARCRHRPRRRLARLYCRAERRGGCTDLRIAGSPLRRPPPLPHTPPLFPTLLRLPLPLAQPLLPLIVLLRRFLCDDCRSALIGRGGTFSLVLVPLSHDSRSPTVLV